MQRNIILTADGSHSVSIPGMNVFYHSLHGALQESMHVFITSGLYGSGYPNQAEFFKIFEMGFGTGLNALLTLMEAQKTGAKIFYDTVELYPLAEYEIKQLNYCDQLKTPGLQTIFEKIHSSEWEKEVEISKDFILTKNKTEFLSFSTHKLFNLVYFDAFAPAAQPELWTKEIFDKIFSMLVPGGVLVTYCSKGDVRRAMIASGFSVEKLPGPAGKKEMIRAHKPRS